MEVVSLQSSSFAWSIRMLGSIVNAVCKVLDLTVQREWLSKAFIFLKFSSTSCDYLIKSEGLTVNSLLTIN